MKDLEYYIKEVGESAVNCSPTFKREDAIEVVKAAIQMQRNESIQELAHAINVGLGGGGNFPSITENTIALYDIAEALSK